MMREREIALPWLWWVVSPCPKKFLRPLQFRQFVRIDLPIPPVQAWRTKGWMDRSIVRNRMSRIREHYLHYTDARTNIDKKIGKNTWIDVWETVFRVSVALVYENFVMNILQEEVAAFDKTSHFFFFVNPERKLEWRKELSIHQSLWGSLLTLVLVFPGGGQRTCTHHHRWLWFSFPSSHRPKPRDFAARSPDRLQCTWSQTWQSVSGLPETLHTLDWLPDPDNKTKQLVRRQFDVLRTSFKQHTSLSRDFWSLL